MVGCNGASVTGSVVMDVEPTPTENTVQDQKQEVQDSVPAVVETSTPELVLEFFNVDTFEGKCGFRYDGKLTWISIMQDATVAGKSITVVGLAGTSCITSIDGEDFLLELGQVIN